MSGLSSTMSIDDLKWSESVSVSDGAAVVVARSPGMVNVIFVPLPTALCASIVPPMSVTRFLTSERPMPVPEAWCAPFSW